MKNMKKVIVIALIALSIMAMAMPALAHNHYYQYRRTSGPLKYVAWATQADVYHTVKEPTIKTCVFNGTSDGCGRTTGDISYRTLIDHEWHTWLTAGLRQYCKYCGHGRAI